MAKSLLIFLLGFLAGCAWLVLDPNVEIFSRNKVVASKEKVFEYCFDNLQFEFEIEPGAGDIETAPLKVTKT